LDVIGNLAYVALNSTYLFIVSERCYNPNHIPTIEMIHNHFVDHFIQELVLEVIQRESFETLGADDLDDFLHQVKNKKYHPFIPDIIELRNMLEACYMTFIEDGEVHNPIIVEVW
jgi:hypothetical protein